MAKNGDACLLAADFGALHSGGGSSHYGHIIAIYLSVSRDKHTQCLLPLPEPWGGVQKMAGCVRAWLGEWGEGRRGGDDAFQALEWGEGGGYLGGMGDLVTVSFRLFQSLFSLPSAAQSLHQSLSSTVLGAQSQQCSFRGTVSAAQF